MSDPDRQSSSRRPSVPSPVPSQELGRLDLAELRSYRRSLSAEEDRVSYWRRVTQARIDMVLAQSRSPHPLTLDYLVRVLAETASGRTRRALVRIRPADPLPPLPDLADMWETEVDTRDPDQVARSLARLRLAEQQLSDYRRALHEQIDEATGELILRYRRDPSAALAFLPRG